MQKILAINVGSSSVKVALFTADAQPIKRGTIEHANVQQWLDRDVAAIGHRIVHGGANHVEPEWITPPLLADLRSLVPFAPNHLPDEIAMIEAFQQQAPNIPQLACFDTAFHRTMPEIAQRLPIPAEYDARGIRRYGFHGLSYSYLIHELRRTSPEVADGRVILAHLGNGSSLAALRNGKSIDTTMAFTPIAGVMMSTRSGDLDPGVVTYLGRYESLSADQVEEIVSKRSGLLGVSRKTADMKLLLDCEESDAACRLAVDMYAYSIGKSIGALAAALGGIDALVFSGGIGEHAPPIRARVSERLEFLGIQIDPRRNAANADVISSGRVEVRVIPTDEEIVIARAAAQLLGATR